MEDVLREKVMMESTSHLVAQGYRFFYSCLYFVNLDVTQIFCRPLHDLAEHFCKRSLPSSQHTHVAS